MNNNTMRLAEQISRTQVAVGELMICWLGQAGFLMKDSSGHTLVLDPYLTNCGERMRGFKRLSPMLMLPEELTPDYYVVSHLHFDHFDYDAIPIVGKHSPHTQFFGPTSCIEQLRSMGFEESRLHRVDRGETYADSAVSISGIYADHGTMAPDAIGLFLEMGGQRLYFSGDSAFHEDLFLSVAQRKPQIVFMSVNGKFGNMNGLEGARAAELTGAKYGVPCHFWTFAEHGGDPNVFCEQLLHGGICSPLCFRQGEIRLMTCKNMCKGKEESA